MRTGTDTGYGKYMAKNPIKVFKKVITLNCDISELRDLFDCGSRTALIGSGNDAANLRRWLGNAAANPTSAYFRPSLEEFADLDAFRDGDNRERFDYVIVHFGKELPPASVLKRHSELFALKTKVLYLAETDVRDLYANGGNTVNNYIVSLTDGVYTLSHRYDPTLPNIILTPYGCDAERFCQCAFVGLNNGLLPLARDFTGLREQAVRRLIGEACEAAATAAFASGFSTDIPVIGPLIALFAVPAETVYLTSEQVRLALIIGALYGRSLEIPARLHEILPIVGSAWGWRTLAREAVGFIPAVGMFSKAAVAWAGTYSIGKICARYYELDEPIDEDLQRQIVAESLRMAEKAVSKEGAAEK